MKPRHSPGFTVCILASILLTGTSSGLVIFPSVSNVWADEITGTDGNDTLLQEQ
jgi:hypothetical protein